jgi:hypothetical protein
VWVYALGSFLLPDFVDQSKTDPKSRLQFKIVAIEVQSQAEKFSPVGNDEKLVRLAVVSVQKEAPAQTFRSTLFRGLPYGKIEAEHIRCMRAFRLRIDEEYRKPLRLASVDTVPTITFKYGRSGSPYESSLQNRLEIASTKSDSIAIAKIYSEFCKSGATNIVKQICVDLDVDSKTIYSALRVARSQGWLTTSGKGKSGGVLTKEGDKAFKDLRGEIKLNSWLSRGSGTVK